MALPRCPYCFTDLDGTDAVVVCARCTTPHHDACWREHGRCVVLACDGRTSAPAGDTGRRAIEVTLGPVKSPFLVRGGRTDGAPRWLEVLAREVVPYQGGPRLEVGLARASVRQGEAVTATVRIAVAEPLPIRGLRLGLRAERFVGWNPETLVEREATLVGHPWAGYFTSMKIAFATWWLGDEKHIVWLEPGQTTITTRFALDVDHPLALDRGDNPVSTDVYAYADVPAAADLVARAPLEVRAR